MFVLLAALVVVTVLGLVLLWPNGPPPQAKGIVITKTLPGEITSIKRVACSVQLAGGAGCHIASVKLLAGPDEETTVRLDLAGASASGALNASVGDRVRIFKTPPPPPGTLPDQRLPPYSFADFDRRAPMLWLGAGFLVLLLLLGRLHGLRALLGLAASLLVLLKFVVPAILAGHSPVAVALVGSFAVLLATIPVSYGFGAKAIAAWLGTAVSLLVSLELASLFSRLSHLTGASSEEAIFLSASVSRVSLQGLLLAGMVVGALGVLADLTVSQASTVMALRHANPSLGAAGLFRGAMAVGHDHIAATVNTLVFAAGASLPVLLIFSIGGSPFTDAVNNEAVAEQIIATLIGSIGLVLSMPITTGLAALLAVRVPETQLAPVYPGHVH
jgi:uncharacterized membrane protein